MVGLVLIVGLLVGLALWLIDPPTPRAPVRPEGVPEGAVWVGGVDGGQFVLCSTPEGETHNMCETFNDHSGDLQLRGEYVLQGMTTGVPEDELIYEGFTDRQIHLASGQTLEAQRIVYFLEGKPVETVIPGAAPTPSD